MGRWSLRRRNQDEWYVISIKEKTRTRSSPGSPASDSSDGEEDESGEEESEEESGDDEMVSTHIMPTRRSSRRQ
jgi:hypothetical protein